MYLQRKMKNAIFSLHNFQQIWAKLCEDFFCKELNCHANFLHVLTFFIKSMKEFCIFCTKHQS